MLILQLVNVTEQWRNFARGCLWARDGWVPHWLRIALRKLPKIEARNVREPWGVGSRSPLKGPGGVQGQTPWWEFGGEAPGISCAFQCGYSNSKTNL